MSKPLPKTKQAEIIELINEAVVTGTLSEFQFHRIVRQLKSIEKEVQEDWNELILAIANMYFDRPNVASLHAHKVLALTNSINILVHLYFIFLNTWELHQATVTVRRIVELAKLQNLIPTGHMPKDFNILQFYLGGSLDELYEYKFLYSPEAAKDLQQLKDAQQELQISDNDLGEIAKIVSEKLLAENIRCRKTEFSYIDGEFLVLMYIDRPFEQIRKLNKMVFLECYKQGLATQLNLLSYYFVPYDPEVD